MADGSTGRERKLAADRERAQRKRLEQGRKPRIESVAAQARAEGVNPITLRSRLRRARDATKTMQAAPAPEPQRMSHADRVKAFVDRRRSGRGSLALPPSSISSNRPSARRRAGLRVTGISRRK